MYLNQNFFPPRAIFESIQAVELLLAELNNHPAIMDGLISLLSRYYKKFLPIIKVTSIKKSFLQEIHYFTCMTIKWIILDAMGVIYTEGHDLHELLIPFIKNYNKDLSPEFIQDLYFETSLGNLSSKEFWDHLGFSKEYPDIEKKYLDTCLKLDPEFIHVGRELKRDYSLALLSNDVKEWSEYLRNRFEINDLFKIIIISGDVGLRKPDVRIFHLILEKIQALPEDCVFVDDNLYNLEPASRLGLKTVRFTRETVKTPTCSDFEISKFTELKYLLDYHF